MNDFWVDICPHSIRQAKFDVVKSLDTFEFLAIPSLNKSLVLDLERCEFIERKGEFDDLKKVMAFVNTLTDGCQDQPSISQTKTDEPGES
jgi:hypothetical protein